MNELLGIQIPEDLSALTPDDLSTFISDLKGAIVTALSGEVTVEVADQAEKADALIAPVSYTHLGAARPLRRGRG